MKICPATLSAIAFLAIAPPARALVIIPVWDSTITSDPNAASITNTINMAIQYYETRFTDPITVTIQFQEMSSGLGESDFSYYTIPYNQYLTNLQHDATTTNDNIAVAHLPGGSKNPITGDANINVNAATMKAIGLGGIISPGMDGTVLLNTSICNLTRTNINPSKYDLLAVAEHEMDEVLGLGSDLPSSDDPFPEDLFRYSSTAGVRSFTTSGDDAWFSLDGTNRLVQFNQNQGSDQGLGGDYGDWWTAGAHTPRVQDAFATAGVTPNPNAELIALDVIGYDLVPAPRPGIVKITLSGTNLVVNGTNGVVTGIYHLLSSTNVALALNQWTSVATNALTTNGNFNFTATNAVIHNSPRQFYVLQLQ